jgi:uncharacterized protein (DUF362 family)
MGVAIAGENMVTTDTVSTAIMGINPEKVKYLKLAEKQGLGIATLSNIIIVGEKIEGKKTVSASTTIQKLP